MKKTNSLALMALATGGLMFAASTANASEAKTASVKCDGGNACKGQSKCHTADHKCAGYNSCAGKGWVMVESEEKCEEAKVAAKATEKKS